MFSGLFLPALSNPIHGQKTLLSSASVPKMFRHIEINEEVFLPEISNGFRYEHVVRVFNYDLTFSEPVIFNFPSDD